MLFRCLVTVGFSRGMFVIMAVVMAVSVAMIMVVVVVFCKPMASVRSCVRARGKKGKQTMQEQSTDDVQGETNTSHDQDQLWLLN